MVTVFRRSDLHLDPDGPGVNRTSICAWIAQIEVQLALRFAPFQVQSAL